MIPALAIGLGILLVAAAVGVLGAAHAAAARAQRVADLAAMSGARTLVSARGRIPGPDPTTLRRRVVASAAVALSPGGRLDWLQIPEPGWSVEVEVRVPGPFGIPARARARAGIIGTAVEETTVPARGGGYSGPLVFRDGRPTCPAVAAAFDRMDAAAHRDGIDLVVVSGFRSDAEQAVLFRRHPDPRWVAPPGTSRHRDATELDISTGGGAGAWLARNAPAFGFVQRYSWEPWHYGYLAGCRQVSPVVGVAAAGGGLPSWVPERFRELVTASAAAHGIPAVVLAALLRTESGFDPAAVSPAGAQGIAQFMPGTARGIGLVDPFDPDRAIPAAARLLAGHLAAFGTIPLSLAAYNAGPGAVRRYGGVPPFPETQRYVERIMALAGAGSRVGLPASGVHLLAFADHPG